MALNGDLMGTEVLAAMDALTPNIQEGDTQETIDSKLASYRVELWKAICGAIVTHIQVNAVVTAQVTVTSVTGVTAGGAVSGPGAGTATGNIV